MVLGCLLSDISTPDDINAAFKAFDAVRRPRGQRVIDSSREAGRILCGRDEEAGLDPSRIRVKLANRLDFILGIDMEMHKKDALSKLREMQGN
jgi:salicylate hydroxylase